jgi:UDP-glucuronate 4-epimerase
MVAGAVGVTTEVITGAPQPGDVPLTWADVTRARRELGYEPKVPLAEGLKRFVKWYRENPPVEP